MKTIRKAVSAIIAAGFPFGARWVTEPAARPGRP